MKFPTSGLDTIYCVVVIILKRCKGTTIFETCKLFGRNFYKNFQPPTKLIRKWLKDK